VIGRTRAHGLVSLPGVFTPSEAFAALAAGAHALKLFPGELVTAASTRALATVLPTGTRLILVGGVSSSNLSAWLGQAVHGFGIGSSLYKPGHRPEQVAEQARVLVRTLTEGHVS
jgi:2-dehydro-3-deoxyphosphogalactonate aldolase